MLSELSSGTFSQDLWTDVALTVLMSVSATVVIYLALFSLVRILGTRTLANLSTFDFACMVAVGAVVGRTAVLAHPNILTGVVALLTLFTLQGVFGFARTRRGTGRLVTPRPVVLVRSGALDADAMWRARITEDELRFAVRRAGCASLADVGLLVLEGNGTISVIRAREIDPWVTADLGGRETGPEGSDQPVERGSER